MPLSPIAMTLVLMMCERRFIQDIFSKEIALILRYRTQSFKFMSDVSANNKRIAKNTLALYFRTFITMIVGLYTGRVMLQALGVEDYGINAVVGGIVSMSSLITSTMSQAISRYITYEFGKGNRSRLKTMYSTSINAQIVMALIVAVVLEIAGMWFLNSEASVPPERMEAANWVLQCSIVTLMISLISSPFNALIIAHERMTVYAYVSIVDAALRLAVCFAIMVYGGDRLILLALLHIAVVLLLNAFYGWYCYKNFDEARYSPKVFDKGLMKELTVFSGWNLISNSSYVFATQGVNMLINVFFGVVFNASRSIAMTVNSAVQSFVNNFSVAFSPQITKSYAAGDVTYAIKLANRGTKITWLMMYVFLVPIFMEAEMLLWLWLGEVPDMAPLFLRFAMFESLAVMSGSNLYKLIQTDGHVKKYTIHAAITAGLIFPLTWIVYWLGAPVWVAYVIFITIFLVLNLVRITDIKRLMIFSARQFLKECCIPCAIVSVTSFILPIIVLYSMEQSIVRFFINVTISVLWTSLCCVVFGLSKNERTYVWNKLMFATNKFKVNKK